MSYISVLVVDDDASITMPMKQVLADAGFNAEGAYEAKDAMKALMRHRYSCIILDMNLGTESGEKIVEFLASGKHPNIRTPIIVASSRLTPELMQRIGYRVTEFVPKPLDFKQMLAKVRAAMRTAAAVAA